MLFMSLYLIGIMLTIGGWLFYQHEIDREETFLDELMDHLISGEHSNMFIYALIPGLNIAYGYIYIYKALAIKKVKDTEKEVTQTFSRMMPFDAKKTTSKVKDFFGNMSGMFKKKTNPVPETEKKAEKKAEKNVNTDSILNVTDVINKIQKTFSTKEEEKSATSVNTQPKTNTSPSTEEKLDTTIGKPIKDVIETINEPITEEKPIQKDETVKTNDTTETIKPTETITSKDNNIATTTKNTAASFTNAIKNTFGF